MSLAANFRPSEAKTGEVLSQAVGVVRLAFGGAGGGEQRATDGGEGFRRAADTHDFGQLHAVEQIELGELFGGEQFAENIRRRDGTASPRGCQSSGLFVHVVECDATTRGESRPACDGGSEIAKVGGPRGV